MFAHWFSLYTAKLMLFGSEEHTNNQITVAREAFTTVVMETNRKRHNIWDATDTEVWSLKKAFVTTFSDKMWLWS